MLGQLLAVFWVMDMAVNFLTSRYNLLEDGTC